MDVRRIVWERCGGYCEKCGLVLPPNFALHHRKLKSRGGKDSPDNLVALHHECHNLGTDSVHLNIETNTILGFIVHSWDEPSGVSLTLPGGAIVTLTPEGTYQIIRKAYNEW